MRKWLATPLIVAAVVVAVPQMVMADNGGGPPTLSFFSGGNGGHASWLATTDQPPGDTDGQAIELQTTNGAPTFAKGYAGVLVHHVTGIPAAAFPDSSFWVKTPAFAGGSLGSPRLIVEFQDAAGNFDGYADLRPEALTGSWQKVDDTNNYANGGWDVMGGPAPCTFRYKIHWSDVQSCFAGDPTLTVFLVADAYGIYHLIDDLTVNGKTFSAAADNGGGSNTPAGPTASSSSQLPAILPLPGAG